jgi:hypothetical protein
MDHQMLAGAVNPLALAEQALGRPVNLDKVLDPTAVVEQALQTPAAQLFDPVHHAAPYAMYGRTDLKGPTPGPVAPTRPELRPDTTLRPGVVTAPRIDARPLDATLRQSITGITKLSDLAANRLLTALAPTVELSASGTPWTPPNVNWVDKGDFYEQGTEFADPVQGAIGDCYLIAALASAAWARPYVIAQRTRATGPTQEQFVDRIDYQQVGGALQTFEVTERVPVDAAGSNFIYARSSELGEVWPAVYEKAYARFRTGNTTDQPPYGPLHGGDPVRACAEVVPGLTPHYTDCATTSADDLWQLVRANSLSMRTVHPMVAWTYGSGDQSPAKIKYDNASGIAAWHAYSVLGWEFVNNVKYIVLRNPWGWFEGKVGVRAGTWSAFDVSWWRGTPLGTRGVFSMSAAEFKRYYRGIGVAK